MSNDAIERNAERAVWRAALLGRTQHHDEHGYRPALLCAGAAVLELAAIAVMSRWPSIAAVIEYVTP